MKIVMGIHHDEERPEVVSIHALDIMIEAKKILENRISRLRAIVIEQDCRGDEDCDHCEMLRVIDGVKVYK